MTLRLGWLDSTTGSPRLDPLWGLLRDQIEQQVGDRAKVVFRHTQVDTGGVRSLPNRLVSHAAMLAAALRTVPDVDALVLGCWSSPTAEVRIAAEVPVAGLAESAVRLAPLVASAAAIVTVAPGLVPIFENDLATHGRIGLLGSGAVRTWFPETSHPDLLAAIDDPSDLIDRFEVASLAAVSDGADAILVGCGYVAAIFAAHGYRRLTGRPEVPVLDCNAAAIEDALTMARLRACGVTPDDPRLTGGQVAGLLTAIAVLAPDEARAS